MCQDQFPVSVCQVCEAGVRAAGGGGEGLRAGGRPRGHARLLPRQGRRRPQGGIPCLLPRVRVRGGHRGDKFIINSSSSLISIPLESFPLGFQSVNAQ